MATQHTDGPYGFPYPDGSELVQDGDNAIQALAEAIEAALNPPWHNLSLANDVSPLPSYFTPAYRVFDNGRVELKGGLTKETQLVTFNVLFTLPASARPSENAASPVALTRFDMTNETNITSAKMTFKPDGDCTIHIPDVQVFRTVILDGTFFNRR